METGMAAMPVVVVQPRAEGITTLVGMPIDGRATSKANEIFERPLPEPPVSNKQPSNKRRFLILRGDISVPRPRPLRKDTASRSIGRA